METKQNNSLIATMCIYILAASGIISEDLVSRLTQAVAGATGLGPVLPAHSANETPAAKSNAQYLVGVRGLSLYLHSSPPIIQKLINAGKFDEAKAKLGRKYLFDRHKVDQIVASGALGIY